jgi:RNA polymerase sigma-70 factor (ECF subfamily)
MRVTTSSSIFEDRMLPHLNAAYTLARWLTGNVQDAQEAVQDAYLRAFRFFGDCRGGDGRAWFLQIVRNTCYTQLRKKIPHVSDAEFSEEIHSHEYSTGTPETIAMQNADSEMVQKAIAELPVRYREIVILREIEGMSYSEMGKVLNESLGNIRTMLFRARRQLKQRLIEATRQQNSRPVAACE